MNKTTLQNELLRAIDAAEETAHGDSNDEEIEAWQEVGEFARALLTALDETVTIPLPETA